MTQGQTHLLEHLLGNIAPEYAHLPLACSDRVVALDDGGMGSIMFCHDSPADTRAEVIAIAEYQFNDQDGTPVLATLYCRSNGQLHEMAVFKADFSPLLRYPDKPRHEPAT